MLKLKIIDGFYVLQVDGVGEYAMKNEHGERCMLVFSDQPSVLNFVERMEIPAHKSWTAIEIGSADALEFLRTLQESTPLIAFDPTFNDELSPVRISDLLSGFEKPQ